VTVARDYDGAVVEGIHAVLSDDLTAIIAGGPFQYDTLYEITVEGLTDEPYSEKVRSPRNHMDLTGDGNADFIAGFESTGFMVEGPRFTPSAGDSIYQNLLYMYDWTYEREGCSISQSGFLVPQFLHMEDGDRTDADGNPLYGRFLLSSTCEEALPGPSVSKTSQGGGMIIPDGATTFILFDDRDQEPVAEFVPSQQYSVGKGRMADVDTNLLYMFNIGDFDGDGQTDLAILDVYNDPLSSKEDHSSEYVYQFRIFVTPEGGFSGLYSMDDADMTIPFEGYAGAEAIYKALFVALGAPPSLVPFYPSTAHCRVDGGAAEMFFFVDYDASAKRSVLKGYRYGEEDPATVIFGSRDKYSSANDKNYPEYISTVSCGNLNGDFTVATDEETGEKSLRPYDDLIVGVSYVWDVSVAKFSDSGEGSDAIPAGGLYVFMGGDVPQGTLTGADVVIRPETTYSYGQMFDGSSTDDGFGTLSDLAVRVADFNSDLYDDVLVGAGMARGSSGKIYMFFGDDEKGSSEEMEEMDAGDDADIFMAGQLMMTGIANYDLGDTDNDGYTNFLVGGVMGSSELVAMQFQLQADSQGELGPQRMTSMIILPVN